MFNRIKEQYEDEVNDEILFKAAIKGMVNGLDPHSSFLTSDDFNELKIGTTGKFGGLGIEITMEEGFVKIIVPSLAIGYCTQILREAGAFQGQVILMAILLVFGFGFIWASGAINDIFRKEEDPIRVCYVALLDDNGEISRRNAQKRKELPPIFDADKILESLHDDREDPENQARIIFAKGNFWGRTLAAISSSDAKFS